MSSLNKILIPFDFSEASVNALEYVVNFVGTEKFIGIVGLYVGAMPISASDNEKLGKDFFKVLESFEVRLKVAPEFITDTGEVINTILSVQEKSDADLIMMGTMGDKITDEAITNTSKLVLEANCPVISIPYGTEIKDPKNIALVMGGERIDDKEVLGTLLDVARTFDARVHVLTIYKDSIYDEEAVIESNENLLEYYLEHFYADHTFTKNEDIEQGILDYIKEKNIDLLTILPRNHTEKSTPSEGRLTKLLTLHSEIPVLALD
ncbi:MAG TPA: universal stress protein [Muricauda sp.]|uniref:Universal stress protein n=1 Tax=Flagellimonas aurea TaxID=2915619 RepID=A0ABS3G699_9FLAO|nr:universal stress protein [Allomuricauda aurea]MAO16576.1 universal stress protein UspA [Allomuricauda sp.]MBC73148.1 universal stress protein UspA [Allomuricauda sp.]MBO0354952.1 universal stress protein [Allomuricauda aurea]HBU79763.1 universal stress protein [Allomuricauda sp.]|tara:strand:- start:26 stop:817 length:792 start_codon:yes stop_codon:yes gene_type:complete